jgi:hypothetical protein
MLELTIYGLMGLAAMLVIAFFSAFGDEFAPARETSSFNLTKNSHLNDSPLIEPGIRSPQFRGTIALSIRVLCTVRFCNGSSSTVWRPCTRECHHHRSRCWQATTGSPLSYLHPQAHPSRNLASLEKYIAEGLALR